VPFNSEPFVLAFLPAALGGYFLLGRLGGTRWALLWIAAASLLFYGWSNPSCTLLLIGSIAGNYVLGQRIMVLVKAERMRAARLSLAFGIAVDLGLLGWFKYAGFLATNLAATIGQPPPALEIVLPLAISFFTFQQIMFLVDSFRLQRPDAGFLPYATFVAFFPHLISGPIVRPADIIPQFLRDDLARPRVEEIAAGLTIFLLGLAKKLVLADLFARFADTGFDAAAHGAALTFFAPTRPRASPSSGVAGTSPWARFSATTSTSRSAAAVAANGGGCSISC
jgi:D-alanyl-lipoteichoic acid acyltransferase DltB (MBOAT superfamily)